MVGTVAAVESPNVTASPAQLDWHIVLETLADGQVAAWIAEWPDCRVTAAGREDAIAALKQALDEKSETSAVLAQSIELIPLEHPVMKFVGMLKDDSSFCACADAFWAEKQRSHDDEEILTVEECLSIW
jgi:predicted RNase H-like HicB family nuclease